MPSFMANISLNICTKTSSSIHVSGHLGYSQVLAILNSAAINIRVHATFRIVVFSGYMPSIGMLGHVIVLFLVFWGIFTVFFIVAVFIYIPAVQEHSLFSTSFPAFIVCRCFDDGHTDWYEVVPHCSFDLHFSNNAN